MKKLFALVATALLSLNASAGYIQYDLTGPVSGSIVQHDDDQSIAYFSLSQSVPGTPNPGFRMNLAPLGGEGSTSIRATTTYFRNNGPTNFSVYSDFGGDQRTFLNVVFSRGTGGKFDYVATYSNSIYFCEVGGCGFQDFAGTYTGSASKGIVNPSLARTLDDLGGYYDLVTPTIPTYVNPNAVPEPGSMALLAIGVLGLAGLRRKQKS